MYCKRHKSTFRHICTNYGPEDILRVTNQQRVSVPQCYNCSKVTTIVHVQNIAKIVFGVNESMKCIYPTLEVPTDIFRVTISFLEDPLLA